MGRGAQSLETSLSQRGGEGEGRDGEGRDLFNSGYQPQAAS